MKATKATPVIFSDLLLLIPFKGRKHLPSCPFPENASQHLPNSNPMDYPHPLGSWHMCSRFTWALCKQNFLQKSLPHLSTNGFPREETGKTHFICYTLFGCVAMIEVGLLCLSADFQLCAKSRKPMEK